MTRIFTAVCNPILSLEAHEGRQGLYASGCSCMVAQEPENPEKQSASSPLTIENGPSETANRIHGSSTLVRGERRITPPSSVLTPPADFLIPRLQDLKSVTNTVRSWRYGEL